MSKRAVLLWIGGVSATALAIALIIPTSRDQLLGWLLREPEHDRRTMRYYLRALKSDDAEARQNAARVLGSMGPHAKGAVPDLSAALQDPETAVRYNAALALYKIGPDARSAVGALRTALKDADPLVRMDVCLALCSIGPDARDAVPALMEAVQDENNNRRVITFTCTIRQQAVIALGKIGPDARDAVSLLTEVLDEPDIGMRCAAIRALGSIGPDAKAAVPKLLNVHADQITPQEDLRTDLQEAIKKIDPEAVPET